MPQHPQGYGALPAASDDPVSATARRIESLRQAGAFLHEDEDQGMGQRGGSAGNLAVAAPAAGGMPTSRSYDNLAAAPSGSAQVGLGWCLGWCLMGCSGQVSLPCGLLLSCACW